MPQCRTCGHWGISAYKHSFYCPKFDKKNPHITLQEELNDPCQCDYCKTHRKRSGKKLVQMRIDSLKKQVKLDAFQKETH